MSKVTSDISMSLDGFITDPEASVGTSLEGNDPGRLHDWMFDAKTDADTEIVDERYASRREHLSRAGWRSTSSRSCSAEVCACSRNVLRSHSNSEGSGASRPPGATHLRFEVLR